MKSFLIFILALVITGCASTGMMARWNEMDLSYHGDEIKFRDYLANTLRKQYLVSEEHLSLIIDTPAYEAESKGLFGLGPKWQEKIIYKITFVARPEEQLMYLGIDGTELFIPRGHVYKGIEIIAIVYEHQNENFSWQEKEGEAMNKIDVKSFFFKVQQLVTEYGYKKS